MNYSKNTFLPDEKVFQPMKIARALILFLQMFVDWFWNRKFELDVNLDGYPGVSR